MSAIRPLPSPAFFHVAPPSALPSSGPALTMPPPETQSAPQGSLADPPNTSLPQTRSSLSLSQMLETSPTAPGCRADQSPPRVCYGTEQHAEAGTEPAVSQGSALRFHAGWSTRKLCFQGPDSASCFLGKILGPQQGVRLSVSAQACNVQTHRTSPAHHFQASVMRQLLPSVPEELTRFT